MSLFLQTALALETIDIRVGGVLATVEVADTREARETGLMRRHGMDANHGMLFVFEQSDVQSFWMKDTFISLSIGFFDAHLQLIDVQEMAAVHSEMEIPKETYTSAGPAIIALEMNTGWFEKKKISPKKARLEILKMPVSALLKSVIDKAKSTSAYGKNDPEGKTK
jgi:uncharacterized membrane protein (UPF0127 family)